MTFLLRSSLPLTNLSFICSSTDTAGKTMPAFFVKCFGAVWMKYAMQELGIYFLVAITSSLYLSVWIRVTSGLSSGDICFLLSKLVPQDPWIKLCIAISVFIKGEKNCCYINFLSCLLYFCFCLDLAVCSEEILTSLSPPSIESEERYILVQLKIKWLVAAEKGTVASCLLLRSGSGIYSFRSCAVGKQ